MTTLSSKIARAWSHPIVVLAVVLLVTSGLALLTGMPIQRVTQIAIYTLYGAGVNFLIGYLGLVPFGASFFFGSASYAVAILGGMVSGGNEIVAVMIATVFSLALALVVGAVILRRRGLYFSLLTLACSQIAFEIAFKWTSVTGGENGLQNVVRPLFPSANAFHGFALVVVVGVMWILWRIAHAPLGRVMQALRDNEQRVASLGYDTYRTKLVAVIVAGGAIGVAGGMMSLLLQGVYANNLNWQHAGDPVLMAALGGVHQFLGPLWGATIFIVLEDRLSAVTENWWLFFAPIIIAFALLSHEGVQGIFQRIVGRDRWTLTRWGIPDRPASIPPYRPAAAADQGDPSRPILTVCDLSKSFGSIVTQSGISLEVGRTGLHSLIGPNGAGKTTFFNLLTGVLRPDAGSIAFDGRPIVHLAPHQRARLGMARSFQILSVFPNLTAFENVRVAVQAADRRWYGLWRDAHADEAANLRVWSLLDAVGLADRAAEICSALSHGEKRLLEIAVSLATRARLLLLDEPLAGLAESDRKIVGDLIVRLAKSHAVFLIEHDIDRVLAMSDRITVLHQGRLIADGKPGDVAGHPEVVSAYLGSAHGAAPAAPAALPRTADPAQPAARHAEYRPLLELAGVRAGYGGGTVLDGLDLVVGAGEVVALLGRNGVGKTTALRTITGVLPSTAGSVRFDGTDITRLRPDAINRLGISLVPEGRRLFPNLSVMENLKLAARPGGASLAEIYDLFPRVAQRLKSRAEHLSGGERQMVAIARALMVPSRLILLDEPFEGLAPAVVQEVRAAVAKLTTRASLVIVEHHAESVLAMADRAYVLVNGRVAYGGGAADLAADQALQERLLGIVQTTDAPARTRSAGR
ncbi:branched-chain amino acid ABC transporter ATP-binding protein/permease [Azospirillum sp. TSO35-2]|uniref:branched-chain amino acid ABC transporter ATP-binding protein/permease n=1 Tax=Azospirillum sp. TSO35-2 TaxID=716796 RepID=UPI000D619931|nr:branched-chain amino acid ABC transporter ATP-binding protein/permease [Azospirillum sp. TSO35-2]PWC39789.1 ABC transporter ATP-binding protein [Azospirillum sp. TSO35-2]